MIDEYHGLGTLEGAREQKRGYAAAQNDAANQVEKMFRAVERKLQKPDFTGIVDDALKCQVFGVFGKHYRWYMEQHDGKQMDKFYNYFSDSEIFAETAPIYRALLYFNLPYDPIISEMWRP